MSQDQLESARKTSLQEAKQIHQTLQEELDQISQVLGKYCQSKPEISTENLLILNSIENLLGLKLNVLFNLISKINDCITVLELRDPLTGESFELKEFANSAFNEQGHKTHMTILERVQANLAGIKEKLESAVQSRGKVNATGQVIPIPGTKTLRDKLKNAMEAISPKGVNEGDSEKFRSGH